MSDLAFMLAVLAIGLGYWIYFQRMKKNYRDRHPKERENPVDDWLTGKGPGDDEDGAGRR